MILTGREIEKQIKNGRISISPYNPEQLNPNSYNLTLADGIYEVSQESIIDMSREPSLTQIISDVDKYGRKCYMLEPNRVYLAKTVEKTATNYYVPMIEGRSSIGRLGVFIHVTAGFGDVGFDGFWTLELVVTKPTIIYPYTQIGQIFFHAVDGDISLYNGSYNNNDGVQGSKIWKELQIENK